MNVKINFETGTCQIKIYLTLINNKLRNFEKGKASSEFFI